MKLVELGAVLLTVVLAVSLAPLVLASSVCTSPPCTNQNGRVASPCDASTDYFPRKIESDYSVNFDVSYSNTYKVVTYHTTTTYVFVQAGCTAPASVTATAAGVFEIPLANVTLGSSTYESYLELIGEAGTLRGQNGLFSSSPCINKLFADGSAVDLNTVCPSGVNAHFGPGFSRGKCVGNLSVPYIEVGEIFEPTLLSQLEWLEYFALAFNKEAEVADYLAETEADMACLRSTIELHVAQRRLDNLLQPRVLWASPNYQATNGAWASIGECPNYYCDLIEQAGGVLVNLRSDIAAMASRIAFGAGLQIEPADISGVNLTLAASVTSAGFMAGDIVELYDYATYSSTFFEVASVDLPTVTLTTAPTCDGSYRGYCSLRKAVLGAELFAGVDVDVILMGPAAFTPPIAACNVILDRAIPATLSARVNQDVWDYGAAVSPIGGLDWFGSRLAEPDALLEEIANILYPELNLRPVNSSIWWKNSYATGCEPAPRTNRTVLASQCTGEIVTRRVNSCGPPSSPSSSNKLSDGAIAAIVVSAVVLVSVAVGALIFALVSRTRVSKYAMLLEKNGIDPKESDQLLANVKKPVSKPLKDVPVSDVDGSDATDVSSAASASGTASSA